jgi:DNA polymerase III epsilon subunit-like protein
LKALMIARRPVWPLWQRPPIAGAPFESYCRLTTFSDPAQPDGIATAYNQPNQKAQRLIRVIDIETTGIDPATDAIIEIASVEMVRGGGITNAIGTLVRPGIPIPPGASATSSTTT